MRRNNFGSTFCWIYFGLQIVELGFGGSVSAFSFDQLIPHSDTSKISTMVIPSDYDDNHVNSLITNLFYKQFVSEEICYTPDCIHTASRLLGLMNTSADPCEDFHKFTCGKFLEEAIIPDDKMSVNQFQNLVDVVNGKVRLLIDQVVAEAKENTPKPLRLIKDMYQACMNITLLDELGLAPMEAKIKELGGWPVIEGDDWDEADFTWLDSLYRQYKNGLSISHLFSLSVDTDLKNTEIRKIQIDSLVLSLDDDYMRKGLDHPFVKAYLEYLIDIAVIFGADKEKATIELKDVVEFECQLANKTLTKEERRDFNVMYNPMTIDEIQAKYPMAPWLEFINYFLPPNLKVDSSEIIINNAPKYFAALSDILAVMPKRTLANYFISRVVLMNTKYLDSRIRKRRMQYIAVLVGQQAESPRWETCVATVVDRLEYSIGSLYIQKYFNKDSKLHVEEITEKVRQEMRKILTDVDWMDPKTREAALKKIDAVIPNVAYPDELLNMTLLENFYKPLDFDSKQFLESNLKANLFDSKFEFSQLRKKVNKTEWLRHGNPTQVNAFYDPSANTIDLPAGILQSPFFSHGLPRYMNFAAIGFVIGHELTHGFDDQGRLFDKCGNLVDWWDPETKKKYVKKAACMIKQYGEYEVNGTKLNGINTQGENIADNGGIIEAYEAYTRWAEENKPEARLPGLQQYSPRQMFWISFASVWCTKMRPEALQYLITIDPHSPAIFRILGVISNSKEFAKDFQCPLGSKMNPEKKCKVW